MRNTSGKIRGITIKTTHPGGYEGRKDKEVAYTVYMEKHGDIFTEEFETETEAIERGEYLFGHLTDYDKRQYTTFCVIKPYSPDTFDGDIVRRWK